MEQQIAVAALAALAHDTRLEVFRLLVKAGLEGLPAGDISDELEIPAATLSFHLKELKSAGLALCERRGRQRIYRPDFEVVQGLIGFLTEKCCQGVGVAANGSAMEDASCAPACLPDSKSDTSGNAHG